MHLTVLIQGFYDGSAGYMVSDTVTVEIRETSPPFDIVDSDKKIVMMTGDCFLDFNNVYEYNYYYIVVKHRNSIETWSASPQFFLNNSMSYDFTTTPWQAYGDNEILIGTRYCIYSGDVNQDGAIDATDLSEIDNDATNFITGYVDTDLTGDSFVDGTDFAIADNNAYYFVSVISP
jgi:hypothetical protein